MANKHRRSWSSAGSTDLELGVTPKTLQDEPEPLRPNFERKSFRQTCWVCIWIEPATSMSNHSRMLAVPLKKEIELRKRNPAFRRSIVLKKLAPPVMQHVSERLTHQLHKGPRHAEQDCHILPYQRKTRPWRGGRGAAKIGVSLTPADHFRQTSIWWL